MTRQMEYFILPTLRHYQSLATKTPTSCAPLPAPVRGEDHHVHSSCWNWLEWPTDINIYQHYANKLLTRNGRKHTHGVKTLTTNSSTRGCCTLGLQRGNLPNARRPLPTLEDPAWSSTQSAYLKFINVWRYWRRAPSATCMRPTTPFYPIKHGEHSPAPPPPLRQARASYDTIFPYKLCMANALPVKATKWCRSPLLQTISTKAHVQAGVNNQEQRVKTSQLNWLGIHPSRHIRCSTSCHRNLD